jgi:predicted Zn-dependent protease
MDRESKFALRCFRADGRIETTISGITQVSDARELARRVLEIGDGFYLRVHICGDNGPIETVYPSADF